MSRVRVSSESGQSERTLDSVLIQLNILEVRSAKMNDGEKAIFENNRFEI